MSPVSRGWAGTETGCKAGEEPDDRADDRGFDAFAQVTGRKLRPQTDT